ncbi:MAG: hypothetical protein DHS20C13_02090 [Thermodesulfobacteriota bacterium]|nr:MAG: hypothetical protein DHS20C13_02090 [Thermodesulfobacteriota bacterium]
MSNAIYTVLILLIFATMLGCSQGPGDLSIPMKAGNYEVEVIKVTNGVEDPNSRKKVKCYREPVFDPYKIFHQSKDCKISNVVQTPTQVSMDFDCKKGTAADAKGKMEYSVEGDKIKWSSTITHIGGQETDAITSGSGVYLGQCK